VLASGGRIAKVLSLDKVARLKVFPIAVQAPWGLSPALLPEIPFPTKIRNAFQEPIELDGDPERVQDDRATWSACTTAYRQASSTGWTPWPGGGSSLCSAESQPGLLLAAGPW